MRQQIAMAEARRRLKEVVNNLGPEGTAIERHGKPVAILIPPDQQLVPKSQLERREARLKQAGVEAQRLIKHLRIGNSLLASGPQDAQAMVNRAMNRVAQWEDEGLCSRDYIQRWRAMLAKPKAELVEVMCGDADGWGPALRQNSPW
jgi:hypothetical protein